MTNCDIKCDENEKHLTSPIIKLFSTLLCYAVLCCMHCCKWDYESLSNEGNSQYCLTELVSIVTVFKCKSDIDLASRCMCVYVASIFSFLSQYNGCQTILRSFRMTHVITSDMNDVSHTESIFTFFISLFFFAYFANKQIEEMFQVLYDKR